MTLTYRPTRQRDRYRVFDGDRFLGVVERERFGHRRAYRDPEWTFVGARAWYRSEAGMQTAEYRDRYVFANLFDTRAEAAEALREMRAA